MDTAALRFFRIRKQRGPSLSQPAENCVDELYWWMSSSLSSNGMTGGLSCDSTDESPFRTETSVALGETVHRNHPDWLSV